MEAITDFMHAHTNQRNSSPAANEGDRDVFYVVIVLCGLVNGCIGWEVSPTHAQGGPGGIVTA